jgi:hypothetical protein
MVKTALYESSDGRACLAWVVRWLSFYTLVVGGLNTDTRMRPAIRLVPGSAPGISAGDGTYSWLGGSDACLEAKRRRSLSAESASSVHLSGTIQAGAVAESVSRGEVGSAFPPLWEGLDELAVSRSTDALRVHKP